MSKQPALKSSEELKHHLIVQYKKETEFADKLRVEFDYIWKKIDKHPFLLEIENGMLPIKKYRAYALFNYFYFVEWYRSIAVAFSKAGTPAESLRFKKWISDTGPEFEMYVALIKEAGVTEEQLSQVTENPSFLPPGVHAYVDYLFKTCSTGLPGDIAACLLPCAWTYSPREIGGLDCPLRVAQGLAEHYDVNKDTALAYGTYSDKKSHHEFMISLKAMVTEEAKAGGERARTRMRDIFRRSSEYEFIWWDLAYKHDEERQTGSFY